MKWNQKLNFIVNFNSVPTRKRHGAITWRKRKDILSFGHSLIGNRKSIFNRTYSNVSLHPGKKICYITSKLLIDISANCSANLSKTFK